MRAELEGHSEEPLQGGSGGAGGPAGAHLRAAELRRRPAQQRGVAADRSHWDVLVRPQRLGLLLLPRQQSSLDQLLHRPGTLARRADSDEGGQRGSAGDQAGRGGVGVDGLRTGCKDSGDPVSSSPRAGVCVGRGGGDR